MTRDITARRTLGALILVASLLAAAGGQAQAPAPTDRVQEARDAQVQLVDAQGKRLGTTIAGAELVGRPAFAPNDYGVVTIRLDGNPPRLVHVREASVRLASVARVALPPDSIVCPPLSGNRNSAHNASGLGTRC